MTERSGLLYAYGVLGPGPATGSQILAATSDGGPPVEAVAGARVVMAVSRVPEDEFGQEHVEARMRDEEWLARVAVAHFDVVGRLFELGPVLPLRLGTVFRSAESGVATLDANGESLEAALAKLTGASQWGVRVAARKSSRRAVKAESGTGYLQGLAEARRAVDVDRATEERRATELAQRLARLAIAVDDPATVEPGLLHAAAYLVRNDDAQMFLDAARGFEGASASQGLVVEVRGPWPPFSFVPPLVEPA